MSGAVGLLCVAVLPVAPAMAAPAPCTSGTGPYQRQLEQHLRLPVDGRQSVRDCLAIRGFQGRNGVKPADGYAGLATYRMMLVAEAARNPNAGKKCPVRSYRVACVDLTRQLMWVQKGKRVVYQPVPVRSGRDGYETRTGWHRVYWRDRDHYSSLYDGAPMPYSQFFDGGQAFHGTYGNLFAGGSHGCVNLRLADARRLWSALKLDDAVFVYGVKPGTARNMPHVTPPPVGDPPDVREVGPPPNPDPES
ncbi:L,D-transpeptidase family protein [Streptomyces roseirectus]|uniref:L,D-transpeptidase family protein n=2 Tax=Streptomyces roseirectus TaxID=2768066 RepID=A0A7H0ISU8_9ACTN|nr:L,D-transpeptidase family protein [Streptomyces roseirectus]